MHSIRETAGVADTYYLERLFVEFFKSYETLDHKLLGQWVFILFKIDIYYFFKIKIM